MTDLIDSLREIAYERTAIALTRSRIDQIITRAIEAIHAKPEHRNLRIILMASGDLEALVDPRKLERVFFNLILNACEATTENDRPIVVDARNSGNEFEIRVRDTGSGIPQNIRATLFDPFVSFGKPNGTGLGLAIVSKIVQDHAGSASIESSSHQGTVVLVKLPRAEQPAATYSQTNVA